MFTCPSLTWQAQPWDGRHGVGKHLTCLTRQFQQQFEALTAAGPRTGGIGRAVFMASLWNIG